MKEMIKKLLKEAVGKAWQENGWPGFDMPEISVEHPQEEKFGDYTSNVAMILAGVVKKSPMEIAESIKHQISSIKCNDIEKIEVAALGYVNLYLNKKYFHDLIGDIIAKGSHFGDLPEKKEKVMVEYSQPNTHKEFHIGHLRNVFLGSALVNVLKKSGLQVIAANYIGDTGTHIAKCLWALQKFHLGENWDAIGNKAEFLGKVYAEAVQKIAETPEFEKEFKETQKKFEEGDAELTALWKKTKQWSMDEFQSIYDALQVHFDVYFWESEEETAGQKILPELLKTDFIKESQGAIVADLEKYDLGVLVLVRKDGSVLYGLKDIPLSMKKFKEHGIDKSIVVVDIRQSLYFKQIFKILELLGFQKDTAHLGYEFVALKGGETMSSRKGNVVPAKYLMAEVVERVKEKFPDTSVAEEIGMGALRFSMLKYSASIKIDFDVNESIRLEGATGPYVQYAYARISSIIRKFETNFTERGLTSLDQSGLKRSNLGLLVHSKELSLMRELDRFPELMEEVAGTCEIHKLPHYAIRLADKFHSFYDECRVIDENNMPLTEARLNLVSAVRIVLGETLRLMGVAAPDKM